MNKEDFEVIVSTIVDKFNYQIKVIENDTVIFIKDKRAKFIMDRDPNQDRLKLAFSLLALPHEVSIITWTIGDMNIDIAILQDFYISDKGSISYGDEALEQYVLDIVKVYNSAQNKAEKYKVEQDTEYDKLLKDKGIYWDDSPIQSALSTKSSLREYKTFTERMLEDTLGPRRKKK